MDTRFWGCSKGEGMLIGVKEVKFSTLEWKETKNMRVY